jgi:protein-tyrosine phosphatase
VRPTIYWIEKAAPLRVAIVARPRGGDWLCDEAQGLASEGVDVVVSMLTQAEINELGLSDEKLHCEESGIRYVNVPVTDRRVPQDAKAFFDMASELAREVKSGKGIAVHCRAGIGRSTLMVASILRVLGWSADEALAAIERSRGCPVPDTEEQRRWFIALR